MNLLHALVSLLLLVMAGLQVNDPDPVFWVSVYVMVAVIPQGHLLIVALPKYLFFCSGMVTAGMLMSLPGFVDYLSAADHGEIFGGMSADKPHLESAREFLGLVFCALSLVLYRGSWSVGPG